jgi:hypothetical protein
MNMLNLLITILLISPPTSKFGDTTFIHHVAVKKIPQKHAYHQTLTYKLLLAESGFDGPFKRRDNGKNTVHLNAEQTLQVIASVDNLTLGIPKILYLVGWQYNGHDSKYPAFFEGNPAFKRAQDTDALESIRWLMREAKQYHTTVSLHINLFDAYEDSPLWETYVRNNIIARRKDGSLLGGEWGYPISYAQEWKTGFLQKRIDSLCAILPIQEAGTIHVDAFHTWPPLPVQQPDGSWKVDLEQKTTSPFLPFTPADETAAQEKIYTYFAAKGIDLTSEGADFLRLQAFEQYQSMAWWYEGLENYLKWPASVYCGGEDRSEWGKLFGTSMHIEQEAKKDPATLKAIKGEFSLKTLIWYYLNQHDRQYLVNSPDSKSVQFSGGLKTELKAGKFQLTEGGKTLVDGNDVLVPANWMAGKNMVAYSSKGYTSHSWSLPDAFRKARKAGLYRVTMKGNESIGTTNIKNGKLTLSLLKDDMILIQLQ